MTYKKICKLSGKEFEISQRDLEYYRKLNVPEPTLAPLERVRRRMAIRNERNLYKRKSDLSGKSIISMYHPDLPYPVYAREEWLSDEWDAINYGKEIDFGRSFFEQFYELQKAVPRANLAIFTNVENSNYCNYVGDAKNSYLCFGSIFIEDCMYGNPYYSKDCVDCFLVRKSELAYECIDCENLYHSAYLQDCYESSDCFFGYDLRGCRNCFGCVGLRKKEYHLFNREVSKEDYEKFMSSFSFCDRAEVNKVLKELEELKLNHPRLAMVAVNCQNVTGNYIFDSKNCLECFQVSGNEDCSYNIQTTTSRDCYDMNYCEENELCYEYLGNYRDYKAIFSSICYGCKDVWYCDYCTNCQDCFGCAGLKNKRFCILNKQYSESEYRELAGRLVKMMNEYGEWGEFFPVNISPFAYNESVAQDYFPLSREEVLNRGYRWRETEKSEFVTKGAKIPDDIGSVDSSICEHIFKCEKSERSYKITPAELKFYKRMKLTIPKLHFIERHKARLGKRLGYEVFDRNCDKCGVIIVSAYNPSRPEKIFCEECYFKTAY